MEYKIIEELGRGMYGTVYKIKYKDKYFALKVEHILDEDKEKNIKSEIWREIDFMTKFAKKHKDQIMQMYYYDFVDDCDHEQKYSYNLKNFEKYNRDKFIKLSKSKTCIRRVYELIDGNVKNILPKLSINQIYSFIVQIAIIVKTFEKNKYVHGDFHSANIGYIKTDKPYIKYGKLKIPTFGYIFKAIDLGSVMNPKYKLSKRDKLWYKDIFKRELISPLITSLIDFTKYWDYIDDNNIKLNFKKYFKKFEKSNLYNVLNAQFSDVKNKNYLFNICEFLYPYQFQKLILGKKYIEGLEPKLYMDIIDLIYLYKINFNTDLIIDYFYNKIQIMI
jgi:hypothetical protein